MIYGRSTKIQLIIVELITAALESFTTPFHEQPPESQAIILAIREKVRKIKYYLTNGTMDLRMDMKDAKQYHRSMRAIKATLMLHMAEKSGLDYLNMLLVMLSDIVAASKKFRNRDLAETWNGLDTLLIELYAMDDPEGAEMNDIDAGLMMAGKIKEVIGV
ncbi:MAG: hypothetical protein HQK62_09665 [Desulfamplus sp.]|nr:hypothetical protein [Desulfamplus sp.]